jgi:hypothetical protein
MKKRFFICVTVMLLIICFTGCFKYNEADFLCGCGKIETDKKEYIAMCVLPQEATINSANYLRIENHTKNNISYGTPFSMEFFSNNNWELIYFDLVFTEILCWTLAGEATSELTNIYSLVEKYNDAKKGKYRIIKKIGRYDLVAEFEVK